MQTLEQALANFNPEPTPVRHDAPDYPVVRAFKTVCVYCNRAMTDIRHITVDHVVPRWVCKVFRQDFPGGKHNHVWACSRCNSRKGGMPLALFIRFRNDTVELKKQTSFWGGINHRVANMRPTHPEYETIRSMVLPAFRAPVPELGLPREPEPPPATMPKKTKRHPVYRLGSALLDEDYQIGVRSRTASADGRTP